MIGTIDPDAQWAESGVPNPGRASALSSIAVAAELALRRERRLGRNGLEPTAEG